MSTAASRVPRSVKDLSSAERDRLKEAHQRLREAVADYDRFLVGALSVNEPVPAHDPREMGKAQRRVQEAEDQLWQVREELLGWTRPGWAPRATLVSDWFSEEDRIYDDE